MSRYPHEDNTTEEKSTGRRMYVEMYYPSGDRNWIDITKELEKLGAEVVYIEPYPREEEENQGHYPRQEHSRD
jgi:hypothetical protein